MKEIAKLAYDHESHVRSCPLCEANAAALTALSQQRACENGDCQHGWSKRTDARFGKPEVDTSDGK